MYTVSVLVYFHSSSSSSSFALLLSGGGAEADADADADLTPFFLELFESCSEMVTRLPSGVALLLRVFSKSSNSFL